MADRSSRPHSSPTRTPRRLERKIVKVRVAARLGPAPIGARLNLAPSTLHAVLARYGRPPLAHPDRASGAPVHRHERSRPGDLVHIDVKKLGNIPRRRLMAHHRQERVSATAGRPTRTGTPILATAASTALDDHSRLAYTEILPDERKETATAFLACAHAFYAAAGVTIERVISDDGWPCACRLPSGLVRTGQRAEVAERA
jgi:hypothetical protein